MMKKGFRFSVNSHIRILHFGKRILDFGLKAVVLKLRTESHGKVTEEASSDQNQVPEEYKFTMLYLLMVSSFSVASAHLQLVGLQS